MPYENSEGIILRTYDWSETSRIVVIWTRDFGKIRVLAKGGRRLKSNFEVSLDLLTVCSIVWLRKTVPGGLEILTEARLKEQFPALRTHLQALHLGYYTAELLDMGTEDYNPDPALFDAVVALLRGTQNVDFIPEASTCLLEWIWLSESGHKPELDRCVQCGNVPPAAATVRVSSSAGGIVCASCRAENPLRDVWDVGPLARQFLSHLSDCLEPATLPDRLETDGNLWRSLGPQGMKEVRRMLGSWIVYFLHRRPKMLDLMG